MGSARPLQRYALQIQRGGTKENGIVKKNEHNRRGRRKERKGCKLLNRKDDVDGPR